MKFTSITAIVASVFFSQAMGAAIDDIEALAARQSAHPVAFNVAIAGKGADFLLMYFIFVSSNEFLRFVSACGSGTTITCTLAPGQSCKGNFSPAQASIEIIIALSGCHVSLYPQSNQQGGVTERLDTGTAGICVFTGSAIWKSYGIYC